MEHIVRFMRGFNCIKFECIHGSSRCAPGKGGSHGIHGLDIHFVSKGEEGAVQFLLYTDWLPQKIEPDSIGVLYPPTGWDNGHMMPADLGYHSKTPRYEDDKPITDSCEYTDGAPCYYDGSGLNASLAMYTLVNGGDDALWRFLDEYYECVFHGAEFPKVTEYPAATR